MEKADLDENKSENIDSNIDQENNSVDFSEEKEKLPKIKSKKIKIGSSTLHFLPIKLKDDNECQRKPVDEIFENFIEKGKEGSKYKIVNGKVLGRSSSIWLTNIDHGRRHQPLQLMTMEDNIKFSKHKDIKGKEYQHYDNYDAIEVPYTDTIPSDYDDVMGVPISFLDKYCPAQFEILGVAQGSEEVAGDYYLGIISSIVYDGGKARPYLNGKSVYNRILIRKKR
jgi:hypothetical protein